MKGLCGNIAIVAENREAYKLKILLSYNTRRFNGKNESGKFDR